MWWCCGYCWAPGKRAGWSPPDLLRRKSLKGFAINLTQTLAVLGTVLLLAAGSAVGQNSGPATRTENSGGISVKATYLTAAHFKATPNDPLIGKVDPERTLVIAITLDTHSGNLSAYDFVKNALLRNDRGQQLAAIRWVPTAEGPHHRGGGLVFPKTVQSGQSFESDAKALELVVRNLGGVAERVFRWSLPLP